MASTAEDSIAILGAGPGGSVLAAALAASGRPVTLVEARSERRDQIRADGLRVAGIQRLQGRPTRLLDSLAPLRDEPPEILLLCTKAWSLRALLPELVRIVGPRTLVACFQNGIGPEDEVAAQLPREQVARAVLNFAGGIHEDTGVVELQWFNPPNYLGPLLAPGASRLGRLAEISASTEAAEAPRWQGARRAHIRDMQPTSNAARAVPRRPNGAIVSASRLGRLVRALDGCGLRTELVEPEPLRRQVFFKAILSAALTPLCSVSGITMRQAMSYPHTRALARRIIAEGLTVAAAVGYTYGEDAAEACMRYLAVGGDHMPSMWTDLRRGTPTEIEYINGRIVELSLMFDGIDADVNRFFTSAVVTEEIKTGARDPLAIPAYLAQR